MKLNKVLPLVVALSLMFGISACKNNDDSNKWGDSAKIIGTVGKENIYDTELKFYYNMNKDQRESEEDIDKISDEEKEQYWETNKDKKQALIDKTYEDLVNLKIMLKLARDKGVKLEEEDMAIIDYNVSSFIKAKADEDKELAEELMKQMYGISIDEYKLIHKDYLTAYDKYYSPVIEKIDVSYKEFEDKFNENKEDFIKINVRYIF